MVDRFLNSIDSQVQQMEMQNVAILDVKALIIYNMHQSRHVRYLQLDVLQDLKNMY